MEVDNPLSRKFLMRYPAEAARTLEQVSAEHVAALFSELPVEQIAEVLAIMLPEMAAACVAKMRLSNTVKLLNELSVSSFARIYRHLSAAKQEEILLNLADKTRKQLEHYLQYPAHSAAVLLDTAMQMLPENVTVAEALRRIVHFGQNVGCDVYIVDDAHHLVGMVELGKLLKSNQHARLRDIMNRKTQPVSAYATTESLLQHPGWATHRQLPVVERDNTLMGLLNYACLQEAVNETGTLSSRDPLESLLSLPSLYWMSVAQLLDSVLSITRGGTREKDHEC